MPVKVSVVVPVYNPGVYIEDCIASLKRQSLPPDEYEVVFVDDGSTDGTPARLDELAAEDSHVRVIHQENSGWSGKPRNVGIAASQGEYVMFVDNDDYLGDEALERMYDYGVANGADVIVGKMAGKGRPVPVELFRRNHPHATVENAPLIDSLTPHKMFRRAFLDDIGLRFPEGRRRLEDHVFIAEAYLRADNVSVLSDYVCYYHVRRDDASNAGFQQFEPAGYFKNLREALDVVETYTKPGDLRDRLFRRWLRNEMVERMRGKRLLAMPEDYRRSLFTEIHATVVERFGPGVAAGLPPTQRVVAELIAADRYADVVAFAEWEAGIALRAVPEGVEWQDGSLRVALRTEFTSGGEPMLFPADGVPATGGPPLDAAEAIAWVSADSVARFDTTTGDLLLRERASSAQHFQSVQVTRETVPEGDGDRVRLVLRVTATVDPATAAGGVPPADGLWDAFVRVRLGGWTKECRLGPAPAHDRPVPQAAVAGGRTVLPYWTHPHGNLALAVDRAPERLGLDRATPGTVTVSDDHIQVPLPLYVAGERKIVLRLGSASIVDVPGTLSPAADGSGSVLEAELPLAELRASTWRVALSPVPEATEPRFLVLPFALRVTGETVRAVRAPNPGGLERLARRVRRKLGRVLRGATSRIKNGRR
ncbi:glycosyltransferase family 2 protein [Streptomyces sp. S3(2020)]|uniref:glycosyltransferase family 2 protein n=1 Tax=Streptomyces sp. S3(2020) TaxID=2732044 RepID=UPI00148868EE|nr:glycosyltransferase family 2 protein [Streptomyces sp. S3(2020)]NNN30142.1 glycosyltransferase family 2 protein [Streptomyces sp. S3(2020)]